MAILQYLRESLLIESHFATTDLNPLDGGEDLTIEIFKNPSRREIIDIISFQEWKENGVRMIYTYDGDLFAWDGTVGHTDVIDYLDLNTPSIKRLIYTNNNKTLGMGFHDYNYIKDKYVGGIDEFLKMLKIAIPQCKKIISEHDETLHEFT